MSSARVARFVRMTEEERRLVVLGLPCACVVRLLHRETNYIS
jgi:hypothetical protein